MAAAVGSVAVAPGTTDLSDGLRSLPPIETRMRFAAATLRATSAASIFLRKSPVSDPSTARLSTETVSPAFRSAAATRSGYPPPPAASPAPLVNESPSATMRKAPSAVAVAKGTAGVGTGVAEGSTGSPRRPCSAAAKPAARTAAVARPSAAGKNHKTRRRPVSVTGAYCAGSTNLRLTRGVQHGCERRRRRSVRRRAREALWRPGSRIGRVLRAPPRRGVRVPRAERRGKDDDDPDARRPREAFAGPHRHRRA